MGRTDLASAKSQGVYFFKPTKTPTVGLNISDSHPHLECPILCNRSGVWSWNAAADLSECSVKTSRLGHHVSQRRTTETRGVPVPLSSHHRLPLSLHRVRHEEDLSPITLCGFSMWAMGSWWSLDSNEAQTLNHLNPPTKWAMQLILCFALWCYWPPSALLWSRFDLRPWGSFLHRSLVPYSNEPPKLRAIISMYKCVASTWLISIFE